MMFFIFRDDNEVEASNFSVTCSPRIRSASGAGSVRRSTAESIAESVAVLVPG